MGTPSGTGLPMAADQMKTKRFVLGSTNVCLMIPEQRKVMDVITRQCLTFNDSLGQLPLELGQGWVITP